MSIYELEAPFGASDKTSQAMRKAIDSWFDAYYGAAADGADPCQRIAYTLVSKLAKTVFAEYSAVSADPVRSRWLQRLDAVRLQALQLALVGGECFIKPCPGADGDFSFRLIPRNNVLIFARDAAGRPVDMGFAERRTEGRYFYTLLERRTVGSDGLLTIRYKLLRSLNERNPGTEVPLGALPEYAALQENARFSAPLGGVGLVSLKTPILNCVDGSADGVAVFAPVMDIIANLDRNEAQLCGEFERGQSRIVVSADMLSDGALQDNLFVGLDEDPDRVGITLFSPQLRQQAYLERKQEYLRNIESVIGLKRGMLCDANMDERTATEISASAAEFNLTVMELQNMWSAALQELMQLCQALAQVYGSPVAQDGPVAPDWGNGVLYDEQLTWQGYLQMVSQGILKPEIALGWRFGMRTETQEELAAVRRRFMPERAEMDSAGSSGGVLSRSGEKVPKEPA